MNDIVKSRRGVYYKQDASPYRITVYGLVFVFSSQAKMRQFEKRVKTLHDKIIDKVTDAYNLLDQDIDMIFYERNENSLVQSYKPTCLDKLVHLKAYKEVEPEWETLKANQNR